MYKKIILLLLTFSLIILSGCTAVEPTMNSVNQTQEDTKYVKSVWITYYELSAFTVGKTEKEFKRGITKAFKDLKNNGFNRVTVHIRPCADAFYNSSVFPVSEYCFSYQGSELIYDPLEIMTQTAHKLGLSIEAWINPYRVSQSNDFSKLAEDNIALKWKDTENIIALENGIYFNPASSEVTDLIVKGVREIAQGYDVDSICFDDYFYPTKDSSIDKDLYTQYKASGGDKSLQEWRRDNVSDMIKKVYSAIKECNNSITFGISPAANIENNYSSLYADVEKWCSQEGYIDYICPQIYFGFQNENLPFMKTVKLWCTTAKNCDLYVALPLYKAEKEDEFAGELGKDEFIKNNNILSRQVIYLSKLSQVRGFYIFSYSSLKDNDETNNLYSAMQNSLSE